MSGHSMGNQGGPPHNMRSYSSNKQSRRPRIGTEARIVGAPNAHNSGMNYNVNNSNSNQNNSNRNNSNASGSQNFETIVKSSKLNVEAKEFVPRAFYSEPPPPPQSYSYDERADPMYNLSFSAPAFVPREVPGYSLPQALPVVDQFANMSLVEQTENPMVTEFRQALDMMSSQQSPVIDSYIQQLFSNIESNINDAESYYQLIEILYTQCVYCPNFHYTGAKVLLCFCPPNVSNPFFVSFLQSFMERLDLDFCRREELAHDPELMSLLCGLAFFLGELFVCLMTDGTPDPVVTQSLPLKLIQMMLTLLGNPTEHTVKTAAQLCKLVGGHLQDSVQNDPRMQSQLEELFNIFRALLNTSSLNEICTLLITSLLKAKDNNWGRNEYYPPSTSSGNTSYGMGPEGVYYQADGTPMGFGPGEEYELDEDEQLEYQRWQEERDEPPFPSDQASGYTPWSDSLEPGYNSYESDRYNDLVLDAEAEAAYDQFILEQQQQLQNQGSRGPRH